MAELTDTQVQEACAQFCGYVKAHDDRLEGAGWWESKDGYLTCQLPDYLHSPDAADELITTLQAQGFCLNLNLNGGEWAVEIVDGNGPQGTYISPDWIGALANAVAQLQIAKEAGNVG